MKAPLNKALEFIDACIQFGVVDATGHIDFDDYAEKTRAELKAYIEGAKDITDQPIFIDRVTRSHDYLLKGIKDGNA